DPDAVVLKAPGPALNARRLGALLEQPGACDRHAGRAKCLLIAAALAEYALERRRSGGRTAAFDPEQSVATRRHPHPLVLKPPAAPLPARGLRPLLDEPGPRDAPVAGAESLLIVLTRAGDLATGHRLRLTRPLEVELAGAALRHPYAVGVVAP